MKRSSDASGRGGRIGRVALGRGLRQADAPEIALFHERARLRAAAAAVLSADERSALQRELAELAQTLESLRINAAL